MTKSDLDNDDDLIFTGNEEYKLLFIACIIYLVFVSYLIYFVVVH